MFDEKFKDELFGIVRIVIILGLAIGFCLLFLDILSSKPENNINQIICFEKEVYVLGKGNVSCILCKDSADNYMSCDYDRVNRSLKGVFYR